MKRFDNKKAYSIYEEGVKLVKNPLMGYHEIYVMDYWKRANHRVKTQNEFIKRGEQDEIVTSASLLCEQVNEVQLFTVRASKKYTIEQYFKFILGSEYLCMSKQQLAIFINS